MTGKTNLSSEAFESIRRGLQDAIEGRFVEVSVNKLYVMANESYEDFARALQTEHEEDRGVTFGKVPITAIARLARVVDGQEKPIGRVAADSIKAALVAQKLLDDDGRIQTAFDPRAKEFKLELPKEHAELTTAVVDLLAGYQIERQIRRDKEELANEAEEA